MLANYQNVGFAIYVFKNGEIEIVFKPLLKIKGNKKDEVLKILEEQSPIKGWSFDLEKMTAKTVIEWGKDVSTSKEEKLALFNEKYKIGLESAANTILATFKK
ncbi:MAG: hypothetical protein ACOX3T_01865 [Bdellovibrionota bacterium]